MCMKKLFITFDKITTIIIWREGEGCTAEEKECDMFSLTLTMI